MTFVAEPQRKTPVLAEHEVVVLGGGPTGIAAAAAAARAGRSTILVERYGFLGGAGTAAGLANFCGLHGKVDGEDRQVVHGIADDVLARLKSMDALSEPHSLFGGRIQAQAYDVSAYKLAADQLLTQANVRLLFHAFAVDYRDGYLLVETKSGRRARMRSSTSPAASGFSSGPSQTSAARASARTSPSTCPRAACASASRS